MSIIWDILNFAFGLLFGSFALANITLPFAVTIPTLRKLQKAGVLLKNVPAYIIYTPPFSWIVYTTLLYFAYKTWLPNHITALAIGFILAIPGQAIGTLQGMKRKDISDDFFENYGSYIDKAKLDEARLHGL